MVHQSSPFRRGVARNPADRQCKVGNPPGSEPDSGKPYTAFRVPIVDMLIRQAF